MAVAFRSVASQYTGGSYNSTVPVPAGATTGDILVASWGGLWNGNTPVLPPGFLPVYAQSITYYSTLLVGIKRAGPAESPYLFTSSGSGFGAFVTPFVACYSGVAADGPLSVVGAPVRAALTSSCGFPDITVPAASGMVLLIGTATPVSGGATFTPPATYTERLDTGGAFLADKAAGTGAIGAQSAVLSASSYSIGISLHLTPTTVVPKNTIQPTLAGNNWSGQSMRVDPQYWAGNGSYTVVWKRDGVVI